MKKRVVFVLGMLAGAALLRVVVAQNVATDFRALNHIGIVVEDYEKSLDFYTNVLGLRVAYTVPKADGSPLLTYLQLNRETFVELIPANPGDRTGVTHFGVEVGNIESVVSDLRSHGVAANDASLTPAKALYTRIRDPNQVEIEVMQFGPEASQRKAMDTWRGASRNGHALVRDLLISEIRGAPSSSLSLRDGNSPAAPSYSTGRPVPSIREQPVAHEGSLECLNGGHPTAGETSRLRRCRIIRMRRGSPRSSSSLRLFRH